MQNIFNIKQVLMYNKIAIESNSRLVLKIKRDYIYKAKTQFQNFEITIILKITYK